MSVPDRLSARPLLLGVVHLPPLPGAPGASVPASFLSRAVADARTLFEAGFHGVVVENHGDAPFFKDHVPPETVAAMAIACRAVREVAPEGCAVGVNVLRNDTLAAVGIAAAAQLDFLRVNVLTGAVVADQGLIEGRAAEVLRARARLAPWVRILADVRVKHAAPLASRPLAEEVADLVGRGGADWLIVTGARTGAATDLGGVAEVRAAARGTPVIVGSGVTAQTAAATARAADGMIVGTALKFDGVVGNPVDPVRAHALVEASKSVEESRRGSSTDFD